MVFIVPPPSGKIFALDVNPNTTTLHDLKVAIQQFYGIPVLNQRLFLSQSLGENDSDLISNIGIGPFSTLTLHVPFFGGTPTPSVSAKNGNAAPIPDAIAVASNRYGREKGAEEAKDDVTEEKIEEEKKEENVVKKDFWDIVQGAEREEIERRDDARWKSYREGIEFEREKLLKARSDGMHASYLNMLQENLKKQIEDKKKKKKKIEE